MKTKNSISNRRPKVKVYCEFLGQQHNSRYWIGRAEIKFPDGEVLKQKGCFEYAAEVIHKGQTYLIRYIDQLEKQCRPNLQTI